MCVAGARHYSGTSGQHCERGHRNSRNWADRICGEHRQHKLRIGSDTGGETDCRGDTPGDVRVFVTSHACQWPSNPPYIHRAYFLPGREPNHRVQVVLRQVCPCVDRWWPVCQALHFEHVRNRLAERLISANTGHSFHNRVRERPVKRPERVHNSSRDCGWRVPGQAGHAPHRSG